MPFTCSKLTIGKTVDGMYSTLKKRISRMRKHVGFMESRLSAGQASNPDFLV